MPNVFFTQTDARPYCSSTARQFSLSPPPFRLGSPTPCSGSGNPQYAPADFADRMSVQLSTPLCPKASQDDLLDMAESTFPLNQNCPLRPQNFSEPPRSLKNEHWYNAFSSTNGSAFDVTCNPNPGSISDDSAVRHEPLRQVDYLSHDWQEDDMWSSWRYIVSNTGLREGSSRFENALWRAWAKSKYMLKTIPPENINWLKDSDYNWLYGPLESSKSSRSALISEPTIALPKHTYLLDKRPILKKRSISEVVLQKLMPALSVPKRVGEMHGEEGSASANRTRDCLMVDGQSRILFAYQIQSKSVGSVTKDCLSPYVLGSQSLDLGERKLLRFDERVEQFRAVDLEDAERDWSAGSDDDSSYEGLLMKFSLKERAFLHKNTENNSHAGSIIEELPSTTLKSHSPPPQKTLSRSHPSTDSLIYVEEDTEVRFSKCSEAPDNWYRIHNGRAAKHGEEKPPETAEDIFVPFKDSRDDITGEGPANELTKVLCGGKDIAQAMWNDGWLRLLGHILTQYKPTFLALLGVKTSESLEAGITSMNTGNSSCAESPFGGIKASGYGKEAGKDVAIEEYLVQKTATLTVQD